LHPLILASSDRKRRFGYESVETAQMYIHADTQVKENAMARTRPVKAPHGRYRPKDKLLAFLEAL
jgi:integrase/recombinase XerD